MFIDVRHPTGVENVIDEGDILKLILDILSGFFGG